MRGDGKRQPQIHSARVMLDWRINKLLNFRKGHNLIEVSCDLVSLHSENGSVKIDVLSPAQLVVKAYSHFQQRTDTAVDIRIPFGRLSDAGKYLEQCAFAGAIATND